jgi:hypothetical protein
MMNSPSNKHSGLWLAMPIALFSEPAVVGRKCKLAAFLWLVANASRHDRCVAVGRGTLNIVRGEVIAGSEYLAGQWGWSRKQVRDFLTALVKRGLVTRGRSKSQYAATFLIADFDAYQRVGAVWASETGIQWANEGPAKGQTLNLETENNQNKDSRTRHDVETELLDPLAEGPVNVKFDGHRLEIFNEEFAHWLLKFDGDAERLELALMQAAAFIQPNSRRPLLTQVRQQLARAVAEKSDKDRRYATAAQTRRSNETGPSYADERAKRAHIVMSKLGSS